MCKYISAHMVIISFLGLWKWNTCAGNVNAVPLTGIAHLQDSPISEEWTSMGGRALLPCNITSPPGDSPQLIIFYKGEDPIYSVDARSGILQGAVHWVSPLIEKRHPRFEMESPNQGLILLKVTEKDEDEYHCRVDFHDSPTRNVRIQLNVAVPPTGLIIRSVAGLEVNGVIGPYALGTALRLTCQADGGRPSPLVIWYKGNEVIDDAREAVSEESVSNTMSIPVLERKHLFMILTCRASTGNLTEDVTASIKLDLTFPPSEITILGTENPLNAGWTYDITCEVWGSRPPPEITWWRDGKIVPATHQLMVEGNVSRSRLEFIPKKSDDGGLFSCQAVNQLLPSGTIVKQSKRIKVLFPPEVALNAGHSIDLKNIKEGDDVYFECSVTSNPPAYHVTWFRDSDELNHNVSNGIIRSNLSLVLQKVTRYSSGDYICVASNPLATTPSNKLQLDVKYSPVCSLDQKFIYGGGRQEPVHITCNVEALPMATTFDWAFNTSTELVDLPQGRAKTSDGRSVVTYMPQTHLDFGSLLCWGLNEVGKQKDPCVFQIVPAGPPESPRNCSAWHEAGAAGEMTVACYPGNDGGLPQKFTLEVAMHPDGVLILALRDRISPRFSVASLNPGTDYLLRIIASNSQGTAHPVIFTYFTPIDIAEERMSASAAGQSDDIINAESLIAIISGVGAATIITFGILLAVIRLRSSPRRRNSPKMQKISDNQEPGKFNDESNQSVTTDPDIILASDDVSLTSILKEATLSKKQYKEQKNPLAVDANLPPNVLLRPLSLSSTSHVHQLQKSVQILPQDSHQIQITPNNMSSTASLSATSSTSILSPASYSSSTNLQLTSTLPRGTKTSLSYSTPFTDFTSPSAEFQPLLLAPTASPQINSLNEGSGISGGGSLLLPLHTDLSPPEEFASRGKNWKKTSNSRTNDNSKLGSPQTESVV